MVVDMGLVWLLADPRILGWNLILSKIVAAEMAIVNNFMWNDVWTFRNCAPGGWKARATRFAKFNLVCTAGIVWSAALLNFQVYRLGWNTYYANFIAIVLVSVWNFLLNARLGWRAVGR